MNIFTPKRQLLSHINRLTTTIENDKIHFRLLSESNENLKKQKRKLEDQIIKLEDEIKELKANQPKNKSFWSIPAVPDIDKWNEKFPLKYKIGTRNKKGLTIINAVPCHLGPLYLAKAVTNLYGHLQVSSKYIRTNIPKLPETSKWIYICLADTFEIVVVPEDRMELYYFQPENPTKHPEPNKTEASENVSKSSDELIPPVNSKTCENLLKTVHETGDKRVYMFQFPDNQQIPVDLKSHIKIGLQSTSDCQPTKHHLPTNHEEFVKRVSNKKQKPKDNSPKHHKAIRKYGLKLSELPPTLRKLFSDLNRRYAVTKDPGKIKLIDKSAKELAKMIKEYSKETKNQQENSIENICVYIKDQAELKNAKKILIKHGETIHSETFYIDDYVEGNYLWYFSDVNGDWGLGYRKSGQQLITLEQLDELLKTTK